MTKKCPTYILLDRSGSMANKWDEMLSSINSYVAETKKSGIKGRTTVAAFDHSGGLQFDLLRDNVRQKDWTDLTNEDATPRGGTPLHDAISKIVSLAETKNPEKCVLVCVTDGLENMSLETTREAAKAAFDRCRDRGWQVVFLGADFDAFNQAGSVGTAMGQTLNTTTGNYHEAMGSLSVQHDSYAKTGSNISFSDDDRKRAAGKSA